MPNPLLDEKVIAGILLILFSRNPQERQSSLGLPRRISVPSPVSASDA